MYGSMAGTFENGTAEHVVPIAPIGPKAVNGGIEVKQILVAPPKGQ